MPCPRGFCRLGPDGNYGGASFSQNQDYVVLASQMNNTQESYVILSTTNSLGGYSIDAAAPVLDPNYAEAVQNLCSAYTQGTDAFNSIMSSFAAAYGSSFVKYFYYGGYAASTLQMSSSGYIYFQSQNISLTEGGQFGNVETCTVITPLYACTCIMSSACRL